MKNILVLPLLLFALLQSVHGQSSLKPHPDMLQAMEKVGFMEGVWKGSGWIQMGPMRHEFIQYETVSSRTQGAVLVIDGKGLNAEDTTEVVHDAFAVISYNLQEQKYVMRAYRGDGNYVDADFEVKEDGSIVWGFSHPMAGQIRYTIRNEDGKWTEKGEMSRDGSNWMHFYQSTLERVDESK
jgi:hypothetical protein